MFMAHIISALRTRWIIQATEVRCTMGFHDLYKALNSDKTALACYEDTD